MAQDRSPTDWEYHRPVMVGEVTQLLAPVPPGVVIDATFGGGGHAMSLLSALSASHRVLGIDRDPGAVERAGTALEAEIRRRLTVVRGNFADLAQILISEGVTNPVGVLFDFGVSSHHLDDPGRGFSYRHSGPLDMRMDPDQSLTASDLVNGMGETELAGILRQLGEEPAARRIAAAIVAARPLATTTELAEVVARAVPRARSRVHPARRTFQALRIAVNHEIEAIEAGIESALAILSPLGRCVAISYHSLEDRAVKTRFVEATAGCVCPPELPVCGCGASPEFRMLTRGARKPTAEEVTHNRRARSARLRAVERVAA